MINLATLDTEQQQTTVAEEPKVVTRALISIRGIMDGTNPLTR